ncbi:glycosyltransferase family 2 protein [Paenibacillus puerhi]|uniref:glycosyltransferase family 2 protein n=1 Tax=Paenibacillus puerhi TaxID=2692622 RepID=UPI00135A1BFD|nr:glycosyltransferase family 2 protein [Paenibacillus puerhi]
MANVPIDTVLLLSMYNGEPYLDAFLDSLLQQSDQEFLLIVRDDGSKDKSLSILEEKMPSFRHAILLKDRQNLGAMLSFASLMDYALQHTDVKYYMFCDQDDVWLPGKVRHSKDQMRLQELEHGEHTPILIHSDLQVVDAGLKLMSPSFITYQSLDPNQTSLNRLLVQNMATGCAMILNRKLAELSIPVAREAVMHDWWIALVAAAFGRIFFIEDASILYRQHGSNTLGATQYSMSKQSYEAYKKKTISFLFDQGQAFYTQYKNQLSLQDQETLQQFIHLKNASLYRKMKIVYKYRFLKHGFLRNIGFFLKMLKTKD